jgi:phosphate transport system substrate-binding protein
MRKNHLENNNYKKLIKILLLLTFTSLFTFNSCDFDKIKSTTTIGQLNIGVDETVSPLAKKETDEFMRLNKESKINSTIKTTNELLAGLVNGDSVLKTVIVSRDFDKREKEMIAQYKIDIKKNKLATDGVGIIVNPQNPLKKISYNELRKIYLNEISDWKDLDGDNKDVYKGKIKSFISRKNASTHDFIAETILMGAEFGKNNVVCTTSAQILQEVKDNPLGIGFISMNWVTKFADTLDTVVKPLKVAYADSTGVREYVGLHQAYIANGTYPLTMDVYIMSTDYGMNLSVGFTAWLLSYDGQKVVLNSGLVPATQPVRIIELK